MKLQTILIPRSWKLMPAKAWIVRHGYALTFQNKEVDITTDYFHFRQARPFKNKRYAIKKLSNGILFVFRF